MPDLTQEGLAERGLRMKAETLAKEIQAIVAADRWKGRALDAAPPEKWHRLRHETQQFWIDEATRILAALEDTGEPALIREAEARGMERAATEFDAEADAAHEMRTEFPQHTSVSLETVEKWFRNRGTAIRAEAAAIRGEGK